MRSLVIVLIATLGVSAAPIAEDQPSSNDFGVAINQTLSQIKDSVKCILKEPESYISLIGDETVNLPLDLPNWK